MAEALLHTDCCVVDMTKPSMFFVVSPCSIITIHPLCFDINASNRFQVARADEATVLTM